MKFDIDSSKIIFNGKDIKSFFESLNAACKVCQVSYFVVGAFARDLVLEQLFDQPTGIATRDIDIAIRIDSWENYRQIIDYLKKNYQFKNSQNINEYISPEGVYTDIIPYGEIEDKRSIHFPPDFEQEMNMLGFSEVFDSALTIILDQSVDLKVASLEGITILKLIAWMDRQPDSVSQKHVRDIGLIFKAYYDAKIGEFAIEFSDLLDEDDFDVSVCGAKALGRRLQQLSAESTDLKHTLEQIFKKIIKEEDNSFFITQLTNNSSWEYEFSSRVVRAFIHGFKDDLSTRSL